jgi:ADP-dependent NAD(P)H-hydrate dehydratase / NAD(P)H-hydrate epimerase
MKIVTAAEMRAIDRATSERFGVPSLTLMENAGTAVAQHALSHYKSAQKITVVCGKGNNGGDGFVVARHLHADGKSVQLILLADPSELKGDAAEMYRKLPIAPIIVQSSEDLNSDRVRSLFSADLCIDAILGTGFKPPVQGLYADAIAVLNATKAPIIAIDIPSGADADAMAPHDSQQGIVARADSIVTFTAPRPAHVFGQLTDGLTCVAPIGSPEEAITSSLHLNVITPRDFAPIIGRRPADSNKGLYGHVLVIGGSFGKAGAAAMAGMAALRVGAGLSTIATSRSALPTVAGFFPEVMTESLEETDAGTIAGSSFGMLEELTKGKAVLAVGPGISRVPETAALVRALVQRSQIPIVLDADGLNAFEGRANELNGKGRTLVITPHPGEMARLADCSIPDVQNDRLGVARKFAREHDLIVALKGNRTLVVQPDGEAWVNTTGNPGMSTGGTGDILTGMTTGMIAQTKIAQTKTVRTSDTIMQAVCAAVYLHGLAADVMLAEVGEHSMVATDLLRGLPRAFAHAQRMAREKSVCWGDMEERPFTAAF